MRTLTALLLLAGALCAQDVLVISPAEFRPALKDWLAHRRAQGLEVAVALPADDVKALVERQHKRSEGRLRHVVLVGDVSRIDCAYIDGKIIKPYESDPRIAHDHHLADLDGDHLPELAVGRIPADTVEEARSMLDKVLRYEKNTNFGGWRRRLNVIAGVGGFGKMQDWALESVTQRFLSINVPAEVDLHVTYANPNSAFCPPPTKLRHVIRERFSEGSLAVAYLGHGSRLRLDRMRFDGIKYDILTEEDVPYLEARRGAPIAFLVCCNAGQFDGAPDCLGEAMIKQAGGPVAVIASSRVSMPYGNAAFAVEMLRTLYDPAQPTLGEAMRVAKRRTYPDQPNDEGRVFLETVGAVYQPDAELRARERLEHLYLFNLLGDPCMRLPVPGALEVQARRDGTRVEATVNAPAAGLLVVEAMRPRTLARGARAGDRPEQFEEAYRKANVGEITRHKVTLDKAGPARVQIELPAGLAPGTYALRAYLKGAKAAWMGATRFEISR
jgi:hypothetical protein